MPPDPLPEILLSLLSPAPSPPTLSDAGWSSLLDRAHRLQLLPILYQNLRDSPLPPAIHARLRAEYLATAARNTTLYLTLEALLAALSAAAIPVILLKGAALAHAVYPSVALRPMTDIDLLLRPEHLAPALSLLHIRGYTSASTVPISDQLAAHHHLAPLAAPNLPTLELHAHIEPPDSSCAIPLEDLWHTRRPFTLGRQRTASLSPEHTLLHLSLHAARHAAYEWGDCFALKSLLDIAFATRATPPHWPTLIATARAWNADRPLFFMLALAQDWLAAPIPPEALSALRPPAFDPALLAWARAQVLPPLPASATPMGASTAHILAQGSLAARAPLLLRRLFPPAAEIRLRYSLPQNAFLPPHYLRRLATILRRDAPAAFRAASNDPATAALLDRTAYVAALRKFLAG